MDEATNRALLRVLNKIELLLPTQLPKTLKPGFYRWRNNPLGIGHLVPLPNWQSPQLSALVGLDDEISQLRNNTAAFLEDKPCNHAVVTGPRGCGKTTVVAAIAAEFVQYGLVCVHITREHFGQLPQFASLLANRQEPILIICNELSFTQDNPGLLAAKVALDDMAAIGCKILIYATSNRRHLVPEEMDENLAASHTDAGEINPGETTEEKVSLSDRFGLWIPVAQPDEQEYLAIVAAHAKQLGLPKLTKAQTHQALRWAEERGSFNGRIASQFAIHLATNK